MELEQEWRQEESQRLKAKVFFQWILLVVVRGGRDYITPKRRYIRGIDCQEGETFFLGGP